MNGITQRYYSYRAVFSILKEIRPTLSTSTLKVWVSEYRCYPTKRDGEYLGYSENALKKLKAVAMAANECQRKTYIRHRIKQLLMEQAS